MVEVLRHDNFGKLGIARYALEDVEISGVTIKKGEMVILSLGSGLLDESVYDKAEVFDIRRNTTASIAFGNGAHFCIGANLARLELHVAIATMIRRFPEMRLYGTHRCIFFGVSPLARASLARNSMNAVVSGLAERNGRTSGSVR